MTDIYSIYCITNLINGKRYVGFSYDPVKRFRTHMRSKREQLLYQAIRKYGSNNFKLEIIYQSYDQDHTLNVMEPHFINEYNSFVDIKGSHGYNLTAGGGHGKHSKITKSRIADCSKNQWLNDTYRAKMLLYNQTRWDNPEFLDNKRIQWSITNPLGEIIIVKNLAKFCREHNLDNGCMTAVSKNHRKHHKRFTCQKVIIEQHKINVDRSE